TVSGAGAATVTGGPAYNVNVATTSVVVTSLAGAVGYTSTGTNSVTINVPPAVTPTITGSGLATTTQTGSALNVNVPPYSYTSTTGALGSGTDLNSTRLTATHVDNALAVC